MSTIAIRIQTAGRIVQDLRVEPGAGRSGRALRIKVPPDSRVEMQDLVSGLGPQPLAVKRVGNALHVSFQGKTVQAPDLVLDDFFQAGKDRQTPGLLGRTSDHGMQDYVPEQSAGDPAAKLVDGASSDLSLPSQAAAGAGAGSGAAAVGGAEAGAAGGLSWKVIGVGAGVLAVAGVAAGGGGGGGDSGPSTPAVASPRELQLEAQTDGRVRVTGLALAGQSVTVKFPDGSEKTVAPQADGRFEVLSDAAQHSGDVAATARDAAGAASAQAVVVYNDNVAPGVPTLGFVAQADGTAVASGTAEAGALVKVTFPDQSVQTAVADAQGHYVIGSVNAQTTGSGTAVAADAAGNTSAAATARLVDRVAPATSVSITGAQDDQPGLTGPLPSEALTNDRSPRIEGTLSAALETGGHLLVLRDGQNVGEARVDGNRWSFDDLRVPDGTHAYTARVTDAAGNAGPVSVPFVLVVDGTAPKAQAEILHAYDDLAPLIDIVGNGQTTNDTSPNLIGQMDVKEEGNHVELTREGVTTPWILPILAAGSYGGTWSFQDAGLQDGQTYHYEARVVDAAGNASAGVETFVLSVDTSPPRQAVVIDSAENVVLQQVIPSTSPVVGPRIVEVSAFELRGHLDAPLQAGETLVLTRVDVKQQTASFTVAQVTADGHWTFDDTGNPAIPATYTAHVQDAAGHSSPASNPVVWDVFLASEGALLAAADEQGAADWVLVWDAGTDGPRLWTPGPTTSSSDGPAPFASEASVAAGPAPWAEDPTLPRPADPWV